MLSAEDCRQHANECVELARAVSEPEKPKLFKLAAAWLTLADQPLPDEARTGETCVGLARLPSHRRIAGFEFRTADQTRASVPLAASP